MPTIIVKPISKGMILILRHLPINCFLLLDEEPSSCFPPSNTIKNMVANIATPVAILEAAITVIVDIILLHPFEKSRICVYYVF